MEFEQFDKLYERFSGNLNSWVSVACSEQLDEIQDDILEDILIGDNYLIQDYDYLMGN